MAPDRLRSAQEVADMFGVSLDTLYKWNYYQTGPRYVRVGKYVRYRDSDIEQWLRAREVGGDGATEAVGS